jgi:hypothetical protein
LHSQSVRRRSPAIEIVKLFGSFFVVIAIAELFARSSPVTRPIDLAATRGEWLDAQSPSKLLILGDSTAERINMDAVASAAHASALDGAVQSGSPILMRRTLAKVRWRPDFIVVGWTPFMLSDAWPPEPHEIEAATFREAAVLAGIGPASLEQLALYRHRTALQRLIRDALLPPIPSSPDPTAGTRDPNGSVTVDLPSHPTDEDAARLWSLWAAKRPTRGVRYRALRELAKRWRDDHIRVFYVLMPLSSPVRRLGERQNTWSFELHLLQELTAELGGTIVDCRSSVPDDGFYDADHLRRGALRDEFSRSLGRLVTAG